jgi:hypothetical protein
VSRVDLGSVRIKEDIWREEDARIAKKLITVGLTVLMALIITVVTVALGA